jgi:uncharacterized membrane protein (UPF0127 family)
VSSRLGIAVAITIVVVFLSVFGLFVVRGTVDSATDEPEAGTGVAVALDDTRAAGEPFEGLTEAMLALGDRCLRVVIADEESERGDGLRGVTDFGDYEGMLFVYGEDIDARFTMADTLVPLDIGFYAADGSPIDRTTMQPCPEGNDATCPIYGSSDPFRYALETAGGSGGPGAIGACGG